MPDEMSRKTRHRASAAAHTPDQTAASSRARPFGRPDLWIAAALVLVNLFVYAPVRHYDFVELDDPLYVSENPNVAGGLTPEGIRWAVTTGNGGFWIPLTWLSYMADVELFGTGPGPHHVTNVVLHIANTLLLFLLLRRTTGAAGASAFVAALFAVHPLHVESVAWITERKDVLSTLFGLLALWAYAAYVRQPTWNRYLVVALFFAFSLMAKPMLVTLPFLLLLLDVWPLRRAEFPSALRLRPDKTLRRSDVSEWLPLIREKVPLLALSAAASVVTFIAQHRGGGVSDLQMLPLSLRLENALVAYVSYIGKMLWPASLSVIYPLSDSVPDAWVAGAVVVLTAVSAAAVWTARSHPYFLVGWCWYVGTLVPVIGIVQAGVQSMADRFSYVPLIGLFVVVAWGAPDLLARWAPRRRAMAAAAVVIVVACAAGARVQVRHWQDNVTLWTRALEVTLGADRYDAHIALGRTLGAQGRSAEEASHFSEAARLRPDAAEAHHGLGMAMARQGRLDRALASFSEVVRLAPASAEAHIDLGFTLARLGRADEAMAHYSEGLRLDPNLAEAHNNLGALLLERERYADAVPHFSEAVRLRPDFELARVNLGLALARSGLLEEALREFEQVLLLNPRNDVARRAADELAGIRRGK
jgi:protein O-mannosyl-transferase